MQRRNLRRKERGGHPGWQVWQQHGGGDVVGLFVAVSEGWWAGYGRDGG